MYSNGVAAKVDYFSSYEQNCQFLALDHGQFYHWQSSLIYIQDDSERNDVSNQHWSSAHSSIAQQLDQDNPEFRVLIGGRIRREYDCTFTLQLVSISVAVSCKNRCINGIKPGKPFPPFIISFIVNSSTTGSFSSGFILKNNVSKL